MRQAGPGVRIGGHLSIARGMTALAREAVATGCECAQMFTRSPRGGPPKPLEPQDIAAMHSVLEGAGIGPLVVHCPYYVNPATAQAGLGELASRIIHEDRQRAAALGAEFLVVHAGHRKTAPQEAAVEAVVERVAHGIAAGQSLPAVAAVTVLVENGAGARGDAAGTLESWAQCVLRIEQRGLPVGACLDTAHLWGAGLLPEADGHGALLAELRSLGLLQRLQLLHLNDSSAEHGSRRDRHEHIGQGTIPLDVFRRLLGEPHLAGLSGIVETNPQEGGMAQDVARLQRLRERASGGLDPC